MLPQRTQFSGDKLVPCVYKDTVESRHDLTRKSQRSAGNPTLLQITNNTARRQVEKLTLLQLVLLTSDGGATDTDICTIWKCDNLFTNLQFSKIVLGLQRNTRCAYQSQDTFWRACRVRREVYFRSSPKGMPPKHHFRRSLTSFTGWIQDHPQKSLALEKTPSSFIGKCF